MPLETLGVPVVGVLACVRTDTSSSSCPTISCTLSVLSYCAGRSGRWVGGFCLRGCRYGCGLAPSTYREFKGISSSSICLIDSKREQSSRIGVSNNPHFGGIIIFCIVTVHVPLKSPIWMFSVPLIGKPTDPKLSMRIFQLPVLSWDLTRRRTLLLLTTEYTSLYLLAVGSVATQYLVIWV